MARMRFNSQSIAVSYPVGVSQPAREIRLLIIFGILLALLLPAFAGRAQAQDAPDPAAPAVEPMIEPSIEPAVEPKVEPVGELVAVQVVAPPGPVLRASQRVSQEPLLGGQVAYTIRLSNAGGTPVQDKGYNLTISDTLPAGLTYLSASPTPTVASQQSDGTTQLVWDNLVDLEVNESIDVSIVASLANTLTVASQFANNVVARVNTAPDNSGAWVETTSQLAARPQAIDLEVVARQSTALEQATGAGEYPGQVGRQAGRIGPSSTK